MTPMRPYLVRALHDWILDNNFTPYLLVDAEQEGVNIPYEYVENGKIILNISMTAVKNLILDDEAVSFHARFSGKPMSVYVPMHAVLGIYAKENSKGMFFQPEDAETPQPAQPKQEEKPKKPVLKLVK